LLNKGVYNTPLFLFRFDINGSVVVKYLYDAWGIHAVVDVNGNVLLMKRILATLTNLDKDDIKYGRKFYKKFHIKKI